MKRAILIVCVAAMVVLAGCGGANGNGDDPGDDGDSDVNDVDSGEDDDTDSAGDDIGGEGDDDSDAVDEDDPPDGGGDEMSDEGDDEASDEGDDREDDGDPDEDDSSDAGGDTDDETSDGEAAVDGELELHHIDVGQGDSTLVVTPEDETVLIDTGDWPQDGSEVISYLESEDIDRIDHLVATHPHADHIGGHAAVIDHFETDGEGIGNIYDSGVPHDSATYDNYLDAVDEHGHELLLVEEGDELPIEDSDVDGLVLNPQEGDSSDDLHYNSVSIALEFGEFEYVTTGDAEDDAEANMVSEREADLESDVYQAGHHGSSTSSTPAFMDAVDPEIAVVSSDYDSQYGHPDADVLERYAEMGIETYWTGVHGDIVVTSDGDDASVETSDAFSTDPEELLEEKPDDNETNSIAPQSPVIEGAGSPVTG